MERGLRDGAVSTEILPRRSWGVTLILITQNLEWDWKSLQTFCCHYPIDPSNTGNHRKQHKLISNQPRNVVTRAVPQVERSVHENQRRSCPNTLSSPPSSDLYVASTSELIKPHARDDMSCVRIKDFMFRVCFEGGSLVFVCLFNIWKDSSLQRVQNTDEKASFENWPNYLILIKRSLANVLFASGYNLLLILKF